MNPSIGAISKWKYLLILKLQYSNIEFFYIKESKLEISKIHTTRLQKIGVVAVPLQKLYLEWKLKHFFQGLKNFINTYTKVYPCLALLGSFHPVEPEIWYTSTSSILLWVHGEGFLTYLFFILILTKFYKLNDICCKLWHFCFLS